MTKSPRLDESTLASLAHRAYLMGRICATLPESSPLRERLASRYADATRQPVEPLCYLIGLRDHDGAIQSPSALLDVAHRVLELAAAPQLRRRPRRPDTRWGQP